jgi:proteasome assembly chaperone (PAC2) family protein
MEHVAWLHRPVLRTPVMVAAFTGWNDAGDAASLAVQHLAELFDAQPFAGIDAEEFYDFQTNRPQVRLTDGGVRDIVWPSNEFLAASTPGGDLVLLLGTEPQLKWRTFTQQVLGVADALDVRLVVTLGALLADVPHRRPVQIIGTGTDAAVIERFGLTRSRYEGPTGIVGVLHDACSQLSLPSVSMWAAVPGYAASASSPKAALALVQSTGGLLGTPVAGGALGDAVAEYEDDIDDLVAADDELLGYVQRLELLHDGGGDEDDEDDDDEVDDEPAAPTEASADILMEEVERFLRDQGAE